MFMGRLSPGFLGWPTSCSPRPAGPYFGFAGDRLATQWDDSALLLAGAQRDALPHRRDGSSARRLIGETAHRRDGSSARRLIGETAHRRDGSSARRPIDETAHDETTQ